MAKLLRGVLIDPIAKTVSEIEIDNNSLETIRKHVLGNTQGGFLTHVRGPDCFVWLDDEGLFKPNQHFFKWSWHTQPLAGKGVVIGYDQQGNDVDCPLSVTDIQGAVRFFKVQPVVAGFNDTEQLGEFHGKPATIFNRETVWSVEGELE